MDLEASHTETASGQRSPEMDADEVTLQMALNKLQRYREQLAQTSDCKLQAQLQVLITEAEENLAQIRLAVYRPLMGPR